METYTILKPEKTTVQIPAEAIKELRKRFDGKVLVSGDSGYEARSVLP